MTLPDRRCGLSQLDILTVDDGTFRQGWLSICLHKRRINLSTVLAGQRVGQREVDDAIWLVSFVTYDPGYIGLERMTLQPLDNPFGTRLLPLSQVHAVACVSGMGTGGGWRRRWDSNP